MLGFLGRMLRRINFFYVGIVIVLLAIAGGYGGLGAAWHNLNVAQDWAKYAHELETRVAATPVVPTVAQAVTEADTSVPVSPTSTPAPSLTPVPPPSPTPAATSGQQQATLGSPTPEPVLDWVNHPKLIVGDKDLINSWVEGQDEQQIRNSCYDESIRATVPVTDVLDYGATLVIQVSPPYYYDEAADDWPNDGQVEGHVKVTLGTFLFEGDFVNEIAIPCLPEGRAKIEISGNHVDRNGHAIFFNNSGPETNAAGVETDNPWRYLQIHRGSKNAFIWALEWRDDWELEPVK